jgi:hypothetical protein
VIAGFSGWQRAGLPIVAAASVPEDDLPGMAPALDMSPKSA